MGRTLLDKIWDAHTVRTEEGGRTVLYIDRQYIHEVTSPQAFEGLRRSARQLLENGGSGRQLRDPLPPPEPDGAERGISGWSCRGNPLGTGPG